MKTVFVMIMYFTTTTTEGGVGPEGYMQYINGLKPTSAFAVPGFYESQWDCDAAARESSYSAAKGISYECIRTNIPTPTGDTGNRSRP